jgi:hypothetical protein
MKRNKLTDAMIRTAVNKAVREIREDPEKGFQSLIALGYRAFDTQIKRDFLDRAARELKNKNSVQYKLAEKLFCGADPKLVSEFGINLGYHALTDGMQELRENAEKLGSLIPWTIFFDLSWGSYPSPNIVSSLIRQGKELGIYCCLFQIDRKYSELQSLLALCAVQQDCAFVFFLEPEAITPRLLSGLLPLNNVFVFIRLGQGPVQKEKEAAELLIKNGRLCGGFRRYASQSGIPDDRTLLGQAEGLGLPGAVHDAQRKTPAPRRGRHEQVCAPVQGRAQNAGAAA